jgi:DNA modification methylase
VSDVRLYHGDCLDILPTLPAASVDCVITDPPYPEIDRDYGRMTEAAWAEMMHALVPEVRRVLKPQGSAVFILQPNSERMGRMRLWLWEFMVWVGREWGIVQDAYWWNVNAITEAHGIQGRLMRPSAKSLVWCGLHDCYRNQDAVLWQESQANAADRLSGRMANKRHKRPSGHSLNYQTIAERAGQRGGVIPFNVLPIGNTNSANSAGSNGHGAGTPYALADWWTRYICPQGGTVLDPFGGSGTMGLAAIANGCDFIGIEKMDKHFATMKMRVEAEQQKPRTLRMEMTV